MYPVKAIRRVVLIKSTKSSETQDRYAILLKENNFIPFSIPTLEFKFQINDLKECLSQPEKYSGLILTSPRSVEAIKEAVSDLPEKWRSMTHFCVGLQTHQAAQINLNLPYLKGEDCGNAENLSALIVQESRSGDRLPLLFPCSSLKMDTLPHALKENNVPVEIITSYVTIPHPRLEESLLSLVDKVPDCFVFFSPSGVDFSIPLLKEKAMFTNSRVISIGNTTARALENSSIQVDKICAKPTPEGLLEAINSMF